LAFTSVLHGTWFHTWNKVPYKQISSTENEKKKKKARNLQADEFTMAEQYNIFLNYFLRQSNRNTHKSAQTWQQRWHE